METAILHYTAPPVVGGVESVIQNHTRAFVQAGYPVTVIAGRGEEEALAPPANFISIPQIDSQHAQVSELSATLSEGQIPDQFHDLARQLEKTLAPLLSRFDHLIVHNVLTKRFNLPLTVALHQLLEQGVIRHCIAWCHDFGWASERSRSKLYPRHPWDLLRTRRSDVTYVVVSRRRQQALATLFDCPSDDIHVVYNGVSPQRLWALSDEGRALVDRLDLLDSDLIVLMPVRVTQAKNIEYALRVVAALKAHGCRPKLVLTGPPDPHSAESMAYFQSLQALRRELEVEGEMRFVFESGPEPGEPYTIDDRVVGDLYRVADVMFMPSHREGFGMPVLEAGLVGMPVLCTGVPAAEEIGASDVAIFDPQDAPAQTAALLLERVERSATSRFRRRVRRAYTWQAIFRREIEPLLREGISR
ncbi:MAG TPA: glycosyltransferase [Chloroflexi bacterium]|nr:glycosyltransferase [Chloroflexota bacterium]